MSRPAIANRIAESSIGGIDPTPSLPAVQLPLQQRGDGHVEEDGEQGSRHRAIP